MELNASVGESLTLGFAAAAGRRREAGLPVLSLGLGEPDFDTPTEIVDAVTRILGEGNSRYCAPMGVPALREAIARKLREENQLPAEAAGVAVTAGAKQALSLVLMALLQPGDEVIVLSPMFVSFVPQIHLAEPRAIVHVIAVDRETHALPIDDIERLCGPRTRAVLINSPNNPSGHMFTDIELRALFDLSLRHDFRIISDEVYEKLVFGERAHVSVGHFDQNGDRVITINGFSKSHALTGWRIGYAYLPEDLRTPVSRIQQHVNTSTNTFVQQALVSAWDPDCPHLDAYRDMLARRVERVMDWLSRSPHLDALRPDAGFFAFVRVRDCGVDSNAFCGGLLESTGVATTPGIAFGREWDDHFRLSFAVDENVLDRALPLISNYAASLADG